jgi:hypothetical protein
MSDAEKVSASEAVERFYEWWTRTKTHINSPNPVTFLERKYWAQLRPKPAESGESRAKKLQFWAELINGDGFLAPGAPGKVVCDELVANGLVTAERIAEPCG